MANLVYKNRLEVQRAYMACSWVANVFRSTYKNHLSSLPYLSEPRSINISERLGDVRHFKYELVVPFSITDDEVAAKAVCMTVLSAFKEYLDSVNAETATPPKQYSEIGIRFGGVAGADYGLTPSAMIIFTASTLLDDSVRAAA